MNNFGDCYIIVLGLMSYNSPAPPQQVFSSYMSVIPIAKASHRPFANLLGPSFSTSTAKETWRAGGNVDSLRPYTDEALYMILTYPSPRLLRLQLPLSVSREIVSCSPLCHVKEKRNKDLEIIYELILINHILLISKYF